MQVLDNSFCMLLEMFGSQIQMTGKRFVKECKGEINSFI